MTPLSHCLFFLPTNYQIYIERVCRQFHHCYLPWAALVPTACGTSTWVTLILKCQGFCIFLLGCYLFLLHFCHYHSWNSGRCSAQGEQSKCASMMRQREQSLLLCHLPVHQEIFFSALPGISSDFISETVNELSPSNQPSSSPAPLYSFGTSDQGKVSVKQTVCKLSTQQQWVYGSRTILMSFLSVLSHPITITPTLGGNILGALSRRFPENPKDPRDSSNF